MLFSILVLACIHKRLIKSMYMKLIKFLLIMYVFFLIVVGPILHISGFFLNRKLIGGAEYAMATIFFVVALLIYQGKDKKTA